MWSPERDAPSVESYVSDYRGSKGHAPAEFGEVRLALTAGLLRRGVPGAIFGIVPLPISLPGLVALGSERSSFDSLSQMSANGSAAILLVDDDVAVRTLCRRGLEADGGRVVEASDGEAALSFIQEGHGQLDLVITDLQMPRLGGRALVEVLSIFRPELPVLCMTGDPSLPDRRLPTLVKPCAMEDLIEAARLMRSRASEMRTWAEERRARARQARQVAAEMMTRHSALRQRVDLVAVALELQRLAVLT